MALNRLKVNNYNSPLSRFTYPDALEDYEMNPPYQRGHVWGNERKRNLIKSLLMGLPIGALIINDRARVKGFQIEPGNPFFAVVDGKQRISAIVGFVNDEYTIPREWFEEDQIEADNDKEWIVYSDLTVVGQRLFNNIPVSVLEAQVEDEDAEKELFDLINYGGVDQGDSDEDA